MTSLDISPEILCTCGRCIFEVDAGFCSSCGDVMCKDCCCDCFSCGKQYCINCAQSPTRCLKCDTKMALKKNEEKAYLVLDNEKPIPIKNSQFMISRTSKDDARSLTLNFNSKTYKYCFRGIHQDEKNRNKHDYFLYFEEKTKMETIEESIRKVFDDFTPEFDDYGNPWMGMDW